MLKLMTIILSLLATQTYAEQVYMHQDSQGNVVYSDTPINPNSKLITPPTANVVSGTSQPKSLVTKPAVVETSLSVEQGNPPYTKFSIASPGDGETIQNQPSISVVLSIVPPLQKGDYIQIYLDGRPWDKPQASTTFTFTAPDRGTHTVSAKLFNKDNRLLMSSGVNTIYVHQAALGASALPRP